MNVYLFQPMTAELLSLASFKFLSVLIGGHCRYEKSYKVYTSAICLLGIGSSCLSTEVFELEPIVFISLISMILSRSGLKKDRTVSRVRVKDGSEKCDVVDPERRVRLNEMLGVGLFCAGPAAICSSNMVVDEVGQGGYASAK